MEVVRAVPVLVLILWVYCGPQTLCGLKLSVFRAGVLALAFLDSAFQAEIFRADRGGRHPRPDATARHFRATAGEYNQFFSRPGGLEWAGIHLMSGRLAFSHKTCMLQRRIDSRKART